MGGGHFGGMGGGGHFGGGNFHGGRLAGDFHDHEHDHGRRVFVSPFFGDYGYYGSDCWITRHGRRVWVCDY
jgi:hypothetical protein